jgi:hypothetical protein
VNRTISSVVLPTTGTIASSSSIDNGTGITGSPGPGTGHGTGTGSILPTPRSGELDPSMISTSTSTSTEDDKLTDDQLFRQMTCPRGWTDAGWADRPDTGGGGKDVLRPWDVPEETDEEVDLVLQVRVSCSWEAFPGRWVRFGTRY